MDNDSSTRTTVAPLHAVSDPMGSYLRPGYRDSKFLTQLLVQGTPIGTGLVADPVRLDRQADMMIEARRRGMETVLDPKGLELSTVGGFTRSGVADLPWASGQIHTPVALVGMSGRRMAEEIAEMIAKHEFSAVLAPTHVLEGTDPEPWLSVDAELTRHLRRALNARDLRRVPIYYPVTIRAKALCNAAARGRLVEHLRGLAIDAVWLRVHPFGTTSAGPLALGRYMEICRSLHSLGRPLVAEHTGTIGVALLAFGAVGGIESGITFSESFKLDSYLNAPKLDAKSFSPLTRLYLHKLGAFIETKNGQSFFERRGMKSAHGCQESCCPRGWIDMQAHPGRHFVVQRAAEVARISRTPSSLRSGHYMENFLRPASDRAVRAARLDDSLKTTRDRLESWRGTLSGELEHRSEFSTSPPAAGKRLRWTA